MKFKIVIFAAVLFCTTLFGQNITSKKWQDLFSFNNVLVIREAEGKLLAATENGLFYYDLSSGTITKLTKANGLHEVKITAFDYDNETKTGLVGYKTGALDVITPQGTVLSVDIPIAPSFNGNKRINHISISGDKAVISADYGVSIFDVVKKEFGQSAFFVQGTTYEAAKEATIHSNKVYVATATGLKVHDINVTFPVYSTWTTLFPGDFRHVDSQSVVVFSTGNLLYTGTGTAFSPISQGFGDIDDVVVNSSNIIVTDGLRIYELSTAGLPQGNYSVQEECNTANQINGKIFGGTKLSGVKDLAGAVYKPDGPYNNISSKISLHGNQIWVATAQREEYNYPKMSFLGYYHFDGSKWIYPEYFLTANRGFNVFDVKPNPADPSEVFFSNYTVFPGEKGIYRMVNNEFTKQYKGSDSNNWYNRAESISFDENNNLFVFCGFVQSPITSSGYYLYNRSADDFSLVFLPNAGNVQNMITKDGMLYGAATFFSNGGLIMKNYGSNPASTNAVEKVLRKDNGFPNDGVIAIALDMDDNLWIGTHLGLRILEDPKSKINELLPIAEPVIIEQNGIGEEVFRDTAILDIAVDSGNHKWVAAEDGGVYYLNSTGEKTLKHFTKENSPLPSNSVSDIEIDEKTGKVYFVTLDGIVVYQGDVAEVTSGFGNVLVYPNPIIKSTFKGLVTIKGLAMKTHIRITDTAGNLVHQGIANGGFYEWDLRNQRGVGVASGIYFVLMTNEDGTDKATAKIAVVN